MRSSSLGYALFVVCTGLLFVRPTELVESLADAPLYEVAILCGLTVAAPQILAQLTTRSLAVNPVTVCVVGLVPAVALSQLSHFSIGDGVGSAFALFKIVLSFLFCLAVLDSKARIRGFVVWLFVFILMLAGLALLQHYEVIENAALAAHVERIYDKETGDADVNERLCGAGIFANPNDFSRILVVGIAIAMYLFDGGAAPLLRPVWVAAIGLLGHAFLLTQSRGGFTDLLATMFVLCWFRLGRARTLLLAVAALPVLSLAIAGRQTDLSASEGTGQQRIRLWSDGLEALKTSPLFGLGHNRFSELAGGGLGAHNSFVHAYVELGFFGGTLFAAAVIVALAAGTASIRRKERVDEDHRRLGIYLLAILAGYTAGMFSSSRCYAFPTYYLLGVLIACVRTSGGHAALPAFRVTPRSVRAAGLCSLLLLAAIKIFVMSAVSFGSKIFQT